MSAPASRRADDKSTKKKRIYLSVEITPMMQDAIREAALDKMLTVSQFIRGLIPPATGYRAKDDPDARALMRAARREDDDALKED